jgi:hypothetical protein
LATLALLTLVRRAGSASGALGRFLSVASGALTSNPRRRRAGPHFTHIGHTYTTFSHEITEEVSRPAYICLASSSAAAG